MLTEQCAVPLQRNKHEELFLAIKEVESINRHLAQLMHRLEGREGEVSKEGPLPINLTPEMAPNFLHVLNESPAHLRETIAESHKLIDQITNNLF